MPPSSPPPTNIAYAIANYKNNKLRNSPHLLLPSNAILMPNARLIDEIALLFFELVIYLKNHNGAFALLLLSPLDRWVANVLNPC